MKMPPLTLGIEEEYQIINPETRNLHAYISELISQDEQKVNPLLLKAEFMQSQVEVGSHVCKNIKELRQEVIRLRRAVIKMAEDNDLRIVAASTHPFAKWEEQSITEGDRYRELLDNMQGVARRLLIFGMHVHVGFGITEDTPPAERLDIQNLMVEVMNQVRYFIPHILALSSSSPFWQGQMTGLKSYRSVIFEMLPRTGIPHAFTSWGEYENYARTLERVGAFGKKDKTAKFGGIFALIPSLIRLNSVFATFVPAWMMPLLLPLCSKHSAPKLSSLECRICHGGRIVNSTSPKTNGGRCVMA